MRPHLFVNVVAGILLLGCTGFAMASVDDKVVYGHQLMTQQELQEHRAKMRSSLTPEERAAYRSEHHEWLQERAVEQGVTLPHEPLPRGHSQGYPPPSGLGPGAGGGGGRRW